MNEHNGSSQEGPAVTRRTAEMTIERKLLAIQNPNCIILAPHIKDLHLLAQMLYAFDRSINQMRMKAGIVVSLDALDQINNKVGAFTEKVSTFTRSLGGNNFYSSGIITDNPDTRQLLARNKHTHTFVPKTIEGDRIAKLFKSLDGAYCEYKSKCSLNDITELGRVVTTMRQIVAEFHSLIAELAILVRIKYVPPRDLNSYLAKGDTPGNGRIILGEMKA